MRIGKKENGMMRRGQLSIFLIVAIVLFTGSLVYFSTTKEKQEQLVPVEETNLANVPTQFGPVVEYVDECLRQVGENGLQRIGDHGGYLSITEADFFVKSFSVKPQSPTESDAVVFPGSNLAIPYWWYLKSSNDCTGTCEMSSKQPPLVGRGADTIESQLNKYVEQSIEDCFEGFREFKGQGFSIETPQKPVVKTRITEEEAIMQLTYPLKMQRGEAVFSIDTFAIAHDVKLKQLYDLATMIAEREMEFRFFERQLIEMLVSYSGVDAAKLPPMSGLEFELGPGVQWSKKETENKISGLLAGYSQLFQVEGTGNFERNLMANQLSQRMYDAMLIPNNETPYPSIKTSFAYLPIWPMYFDLNCDGDVCKPDSASSFIDFMGLQNYRFAYDASFPVMVELTDADAFNGQGYTFRFALEANVRNNEPMPAEFYPLSRAEGFGEGSSLLCDDSQRTSPNVTIIVQSSTGEKVEHAQIRYDVIGDACDIGQTNSEGTLVTKLPEGVMGARVQVVSPSFVGNSEEVVVQYAPGAAMSEIPITVDPILIKKVKVMKKQVMKSAGWMVSDVPLPLSDDEEAMIMLTRIPKEGEDQFSQPVRVKGNEEVEVQLAPGTYEIDGTLLSHEKVVVAASERCVKSGRKKVCYTLPEIVLSTGEPPTYNEGGIKGTIEIAPEQIASVGRITLYVLAMDKPTIHEDVSASQNVEGYSQVYKLQLNPTFG